VLPADDASPAAIAGDALAKILAGTPARNNPLGLTGDAFTAGAVEDAAAALEAAAGFRQGVRTARSPHLLGTWCLVYTNCAATVGAVGLTGVGRRLPGARLAALRVHYSAGGTTWAEELLASPGGVLRVRNRRTGVWAVGSGAAGNTVEQSYGAAAAARRVPLRKAPPAAKEVLDMTYVDAEWRIARASASGELFVFRRQAPATRRRWWPRRAAAVAADAETAPPPAMATPEEVAARRKHLYVTSVAAAVPAVVEPPQRRVGWWRRAIKAVPARVKPPRVVAVDEAPVAKGNKVPLASGRKHWWRKGAKAAAPTTATAEVVVVDAEPAGVVATKARAGPWLFKK